MQVFSVACGCSLSGCGRVFRGCVRWCDGRGRVS